MKIKKITREGDLFIMTIQHADKYRENWVYTREESESGEVSFVMIGREDA